MPRRCEFCIGLARVGETGRIPGVKEGRPQGSPLRDRHGV